MYLGRRMERKRKIFRTFNRTCAFIQSTGRAWTFGPAGKGQEGSEVEKMQLDFEVSEPICLGLRIPAIHGAKTTKNHTPWYVLLDNFTDFRKTVWL